MVNARHAHITLEEQNRKSKTPLMTARSFVKCRESANSTRAWVSEHAVVEIWAPQQVC